MSVPAAGVVDVRSAFSPQTDLKAGSVADARLGIQNDIQGPADLKARSKAGAWRGR
ncbi:hypothetical protein SAMN02745121_04578 [Nannocystis exedens]|uniref:Uncharacterized protein n=1 Tax=Nannocystis exedens TaxID=54 RepID=A0A1I2BAW3_9BACT|nr:hypothetical protein [Nannocystis exedens]PCC68079.1 hypothetical protein NAEX_01087 [Nannocystis exedens]SFE53352.1 hypothetical protein SAMN02745121_04578 [Nannocystis exedens]